MKLEQFFNGKPVMTTGQLTDELVTAGLTRENARQVISRRHSKDGLWRSTALQLPGRERLIAPKDQVGTRKFQQFVASVISQRRPGMARLLRAVSSRGGVLLPEAAMLLAAPFARRKGSPSFAEELRAAEELGVTVDGLDTSFARVISADKPGSDRSVALGITLRGRRQTELALAKLVCAHFRRQGIISWGSVTVASTTPGYVSFNELPFCAMGFSWLKPLIRQGRSAKPAPTPMVFDVFGRKCNEDDVRSLLDRVTRAGFNTRVKLPILAFIAAPEFENRAWSQAKKNGFVVANLNDLFGEKTFEAIVVVEQLSKGIVGNPERVDESAIDSLSAYLKELKTNPVLADLRALSLESVSALILRTQGWEGVELGLNVPFRETTRDVDVYATRNGREVVKLVECKAALSEKELEPEDVSKFYGETVPAFVREKKGRQIVECHAEMWTTGTVGQRAKECLMSIALDRRVQARLVGGKELLESLPRSLRRCQELLRVISSAI